MSVEDNQKIKLTVNDVIEEIGWGRYQCGVLAIISFLMFIDGLEIMVIGILVPVLRCEWKLTSVEVVLLTASILGGMSIGNIFLGILVDKWGRRKIIIFAAIQVCLMSLLSIISPNFTFLLIARTLFGIFLSFAYQGVCLTLEITPRKYRALVKTITSVAFSGGMMFGVMLGLFMNYLNSWRLYLLVAASPTFIAVLLILKIPESVRFYNAKNKKFKVIESLKIMALKNKKILDEYVLEQEEIKGNTSFWNLFNKYYLRSTILMISFTFTSLASYYGVVFLQPFFLWRKDLKNHPTERCQLSCYKSIDNFSSLIWPCLLEILGSIVLPFIWNNFGRRMPTIIGQFAAIFSCIFLFFKIESILAMNIMFCIIRLLCYNSSTISILYFSELYPTEIRGMAIGTASCANKFGSLFGTFITQSLLIISPHLSVASIMILSMWCAMSMILLKTETLNCAMKDGANKE